MALTMVTEAVRRKRIKDGARNRSSSKPKVLLKEGDWLDVMDGDGVWNVARVLSVPSLEEVEITYDGWTEEYDEVVYIDSDRVAPYHTFTSAVKCWVKYLNWPLWPSLITIRTPGTPEGIRNLAAENRLYVDFLDNLNFAKRDRCWQQKRQVRVFEDNYEKKRTGSTGEQFERALGWILQSDASPKMPRFHVGTLPTQYKLNPTESVEAKRRRMGDALWFQSFTQNRMRHQQNHVYETIGDEKEDDAANGDSSPPTLSERWLNMSAMKKESQVVTSDDKGLDSHVEAEVPVELEPINSSGDSQSEDEQVNSRPKRRRLRTKRRSDELSKAGKRKHRETSRLLSSSKRISPKSLVMQADDKKAKGRSKMTAKRNVPPVSSLFSSNPSGDLIKVRAAGIYSDEDVDDEGDTPMDQGIDTDEILVSGSVITQSRRSIEHQIADAEKKPYALRKEKHLATGTEQALGKNQIRLNGPSPLSADLYAISRPISPRVSKTESRRSRRSSMKPADEVQASVALSKTNALREEDISAVSQHTIDLSSSLISASKSNTSDSGESTDSSREREVENYELNFEEDESMKEAGVKDSAVADGLVVPESSNDNEDEQRQQFCVMQADKEEPQGVDTTGKQHKKMTMISVPRKFDNPPVPRVFDCTNSLLGIQPPQLCLSASSYRSGVALASPSTAVFSSSKGFSMESWFKRKLMADFMNGEPLKPMGPKS